MSGHTQYWCNLGAPKCILFVADVVLCCSEYTRVLHASNGLICSLSGTVRIIEETFEVSWERSVSKIPSKKWQDKQLTGHHVGSAREGRLSQGPRQR